jgi:hypothetical protein
MPEQRKTASEDVKMPDLEIDVCNCRRYLKPLIVEV